MYEGNNPTALNSRTWLVQSLLSLMEEVPYSKITVRDICTKADLSRQTFYNFFDTKDDMIRFCIRQCYGEMMERLASKAPLQLIDVTGQMAETFEKNQKLIRLIISHKLNALLEAEIASAIHLFAEDVKPHMEDSLSQYGTEFLIGGISHTVLYWFQDSQPLSAEQLSDLLFDILSGAYFKLTRSDSAETSD